MKRNAVLLACMVLMASGFSLASSRQLHANIPFAFYVEDQLLPAGAYSFEIRDSLIMIRTKDGVGMGVHTLAGGAGKVGSEDLLQFHRYGNQYFLCSLAVCRGRYAVKRAHIEKQRMAESTRVVQVTLLIQ